MIVDALIKFVRVTNIVTAFANTENNINIIDHDYVNKKAS
jgi:hypothetical protein